MQVNRQNTVNPGLADQLGNELRGDRHTCRAGSAVLPGKAEIGDDCRDPRRRGALGRVDHDEQLHEVLGGRRAGRLDDEGVPAADVFENLDVDLAVAEPAYMGPGDW